MECSAYSEGGYWVKDKKGQEEDLTSTPTRWAICHNRVFSCRDTIRFLASTRQISGTRKSSKF